MWRLALPASLALGEICGFVNFSLGPLWIPAAFLALVVALFGYGCDIRGWRHAAVFLVGLALALRAAETRRDVIRETSEHGRPLEASLVVEGVPLGGVGASGWTSFDTSFKGVDIRVVFRLDPGESPPAVGETWLCRGWLERKDASDYRRRNLWIKGVRTFADRDESAGRSRLLSFLDNARRGLSRRLGIGLDGTDYACFADINRAILLGERSRLPRSVRETFVDAGTLHIFAISGLHVAIVAKMLVVVAMLLFIPFRLVGFFVLPLLWLYVGMVGAAPSAVRAASMATLCMLAPVWLRRPDGIAAWSATFIAFHLVCPECIIGVGSMLSFAVMLGILLFVEWAKSFRSRAIESVGITFAAWAAGVPIAAHVFGRVAPGGVLANLLLVPAAEISVVAGLLGSLFSFVSSTLAAHFNFAAALVTKAMVGVSWAISRLPGANIETRPWTLWDCAAWYLVLGLSMWLVRSVVIRRRQTI
jgi:ComEC/Rec2-related protein